MDPDDPAGPRAKPNDANVVEGSMGPQEGDVAAVRVPMDWALAEEMVRSEAVLPAVQAFLAAHLGVLERGTRSRRADAHWSQFQELKQALFHDDHDLHEILAAKTRFLVSVAEVMTRELDEPSVSESDSRRTINKPWALEVLEDTELALEQAPDHSEGAASLLCGCERAVGARLWPLGKAAVRLEIERAWLSIDPIQSLRLAGTRGAAAQWMRLRRLYGMEPLTPEEWDRAYRYDVERVCSEFLVELLRWNAPVDVSDRLVIALGDQLFGDTLYRPYLFGSPEPDDDAPTKSEILDSYFRWLVETRGDLVAQAVRGWFRKLFNHHGPHVTFGDVYPHIATLVAMWRVASPEPDSFPAMLSDLDIAEVYSDHIEAFALSQWYAGCPRDGADAKVLFEKLRRAVRSYPVALDWYLLKIARRGLSDAALGIIAEWEREPRNLGQRIRLAALCDRPEQARERIDLDSNVGDFVSQLLRCGSVGDRVTLLRAKTRHGKQGLPGEIWRPGEVTESGRRVGGLVRARENDKPYNFEHLLRMHDHGPLDPSDQTRYWHDDIDAAVLPALVAWADEHPEEVRALLEQSWERFDPEDKAPDWVNPCWETVLKRCARYFAVDLEFLFGVFLASVEQRLVNGTVKVGHGANKVEYSLEAGSTFGLASVAASAIGDLDPGVSDEILLRAMEEYEPNWSDAEVAGFLYGRRHGLTRTTIDIEASTPSALAAWQFGVIEASRTPIRFQLSPDAARTRPARDHAPPAIRTSRASAKVDLQPFARAEGTIHVFRDNDPSEFYGAVDRIVRGQLDDRFDIALLRCGPEQIVTVFGPTGSMADYRRAYRECVEELLGDTGFPVEDLRPETTVANVPDPDNPSAGDDAFRLYQRRLLHGEFEVVQDGRQRTAAELDNPSLRARVLSVLTGRSIPRSVLYRTLVLLAGMAGASLLIIAIIGRIGGTGTSSKSKAPHTNESPIGVESPREGSGTGLLLDESDSTSVAPPPGTTVALDADVLVETIISSLPDDAWLTDLVWTDTELNLDGVAGGSAQISRMLRDLEQAPELRAVYLNSLRTREGEGGRAFSITARCSGPISDKLTLEEALALAEQEGRSPFHTDQRKDGGMEADPREGRTAGSQ